MKLKISEYNMTMFKKRKELKDINPNLSEDVIEKHFPLWGEE